MPEIQIQGTVIDFPDTAQSPDWSEAVIQFAVAVENALASIVGAFDVAPQVLIIDAYNPGTNVDIPNLSFPTSSVRSAFIRYSVFRTTTLETAYESGELQIVYNPNGPVNNKWEYAQSKISDGKISFTITDTGQVRFSTTSMSGSNHAGNLTYVAQSILQSS